MLREEIIQEVNILSYEECKSKQVNFERELYILGSRILDENALKDRENDINRYLDLCEYLRIIKLRLNQKQLI